MRALHLELRPSLRLTAVLLALHGAAAGCVLLSIPGAAGIAVAAGLVALGGLAAWDRALLRSRRSIRKLDLRDGGPGTAELAGGGRLDLRAPARRNIGPWWVTLPIRGRLPRAALVAGDMLTPREFRLLRLWALWGRLPAGPDRT